MSANKAEENSEFLAGDCRKGNLEGHKDLEFAEEGGDGC